MYYLIDLTNQTKKSFETKIDLLAHWRFRLWLDIRHYVPGPLDFKALNVTGKDMYSSLGEDATMRRFQVLDDDGRSQDIRTWEKEIEIVNAMRYFPYSQSTYPQTRFRAEPAGAGAKMPLRKGRCGAFTVQRLRDRGALELDYEDDLLGFTPVRDNSAPRTRDNDWQQRYDWRRRRSWKAHTKNTSQWGRHTERAAETPIRKRTFEELDLEKLSLELIGSAG